MGYEVREGDPVQDKCLFCPVGVIHTHDYGGGHVHDYCDGCPWRLCLPSVGSPPCF